MADIILEFEKPIVKLEKKIQEMREVSASSEVDLTQEIRKMEEKLKRQIKKIHSGLNRWQRVQLARHPDRPYTMDYIHAMAKDFVELHGDRYYADDRSVVTGLATIQNEKMVIVGHQKGRNTKENIERNFGMPHPEGYRKALKAMKLAEKFRKPVLSLIDTPGAFPGIGAEERGQAEAIARNLFEMAKLRTPILIVVIGEGASGGALGIGIGDRILVLENTWYSVISPEGCASILYRDASKAPIAAEAMRVSASDVKKMKIADQIVKEPLGGAHRDPQEMARRLQKVILKHIRELKRLPLNELIQHRIMKFSQMGSWKEPS